MEIKVGDYVRADTGIIEKLEGIHEQNKTNETIIKLNKMGGGRYAHILDINSEFAKEFDKDFSRGNIIKSSSNIIDLIEVGDIIKLDKDRTCCVMEKNGKYIKTYDEDYLTVEDIKSIVTREQFSQMEYKINETH